MLSYDQRGIAPHGYYLNITTTPRTGLSIYGLLLNSIDGVEFSELYVDGVDVTSAWNLTGKLVYRDLFCPPNKNFTAYTLVSGEVFELSE
jgi:hypothetical protein